VRFSSSGTSSFPSTGSSDTADEATETPSPTSVLFLDLHTRSGLPAPTGTELVVPKDSQHAGTRRQRQHVGQVT
jgi:hypothetical protein